MARVLVINQYFPPDTSATADMAADIARALRDAGHRVTVLAGRPSYAPLGRRRWTLGSSEQWEGCTVVRVGSTAFDRRRMAGRVTNYLSYLALGFLRARREHPDVVLAMTDPPLAALIGASVDRRRRAPFVYNVRDLHPDMALAAGLVRPGRISALWSRLHRRALLAADRVVVLGEDMRERVVALGAQARRVHVVRDGAPDVPSNGNAQVPAGLRNGFRFTLVHAGNLGHAGAWTTLLDAARALEHDGVGLVFVGDGAASSRIRAAAARQPNVKWLPAQPKSRLPALLAAGDLHLVTIRRGLEGLVVPSKIYPLLAAGRPVLAVAPEGSDASRLVRDAACGWSVDPDDVEGVVAAVREAMRSPERLDACGRRARAAFPAYERSRHLAALVRIIEQAGGA